MGERTRERPPRKSSSLRTRARSRHDADRHGRDVRRTAAAEQCRGRGDQGAARRGLRRQQGAALQRQPRRVRSPPARRSLRNGSAPTRVDLYLLHWRGRLSGSPETVAAFEDAAAGGQDPRRLGRLQFRRPTTWRNCSAVPDGGNVAANQVLYNLARRGIEYRPADPGQPAIRGVPVMAYSPLDEGRLLRDAGARSTSPRRTRRRAAQVALALLKTRSGVIRDPEDRFARTRPRRPGRDGYRADDGKSRRTRPPLPAAEEEDAAGGDLRSDHGERCPDCPSSACRHLLPARGAKGDKSELALQSAPLPRAGRAG